jgi:predicted permease
MIKKSPGFAAAVILVLGFSIGGNIAIFSVVNAALIHPLPYKDPDGLVLLWGNVQRKAVERRGASFPDYLDWQKTNKSFEGLAGFWSASLAFNQNGERVLIPAEIIGAKYFSLLGVKPVIGRDFMPEEEANFGSTSTVILGHSFWKDSFGGDPNAVGKTLELDSHLYTIIGIMPLGFVGLTDQASLFILPSSLPDFKDMTANRGARWFAALGRLREGVSRQQAQAEMTNISLSLEKAYPGSNDKRSVEVASLIDETFGQVRPALLTLLGAVGMVLLIACANVANLILARAETRQTEIGVRTALGAGRRDVLQLLMTESLVLSGLGTALGVVLAGWSVKLTLAVSPIQLPTFVNVGLDRYVVVFAAALAIVTGTFMGLISWMQVGQSTVGESLKAGSARSSGLPSRRRFRNALMIVEVALTVVLLVGAGLFIQSFRRMTQVDPGFRTERLLSATVAASSGERVNRQLLYDALAALPSVESVSLATDAPFAGANAMFYTAEGQPPVDATNVPRAFAHRVSPGYFNAMGIGLRHGREFDANEPNSSVIVSENVVKRFWAGQDPIGKRIKSGNATSNSPWLNIVGVVGDTRTRGLPNNPTADPDVYFPYTGDPGSAALLIRTSGDPASVAPAMREAIHRLNKTLLISNVATMDEMMRPFTARSRFISWLTSVFSAVALILALVGIYGTMSYTITQRTREIGIRFALGASSRELMTLILRSGLMPVIAGLLGGIVGGVGMSRSLQGLLFGVSATDPSIFTLVALLIITTGTVAVFIPASRALRVDPIRALRDE